MKTNQCQQKVEKFKSGDSQIKPPVNHNYAYLLEVFDDSLRLEMPCLLAADLDNKSDP